MAKIAAGNFQLKSEEQKQVVLMLCTGFFMGVFLSIYQVTADSLFLNHLGHHLNRAFLIAGALGIITTAVFSFFQSRIRFTTLVLSSVLIIFTYTMGVFLLLNHGDPAWREVLLFSMYCMTGPITAVLLLGFWGIFGRLFNFRQSKRIIGWIDTGQLIAAIVATFSIPFTDRIIPKTSDYLLICALSILVMSLLLVVIAVSFKISKNNPREFGAFVRNETKLKKLLGDPYVLLLSTFMVISMVTFAFNQYSFQELVKEQYPTERELTNFNAFFTGSVYGLSLIMQTFVNNRVISNYGLRISLFLVPLAVGLFAIGSLLTGGLSGLDKQTGFIYFFLFISLSRLFNWALRDSLENPVFKLFFIPLANNLRFSIQSKVEGIVNESGRFIAGLLIFGFALIPAFEIIHISVLLVILTVLYFIIINKLYNGYRQKIRAKLESPDLQQDKLEKGITKITSRLEQFLNVSSTSRAVFSFKLLEKINASNIPQWINHLLRNESEAVRHYGQERMNELKGLSVSDKYVIRVDETRNAGQEKKLLSPLDLQMIIQDGGDVNKTRIQKLSWSTNPEDRQYAAELLLHTSRDECISFLIDLLNDAEPKVRNTAIKTSVRKNTPEVIHILIDNLGNPIFSNQAMNALVLIGEPSLHALETAFYRSGQTTPVILRLIQVIGKIGGSRAREILWGKIDYPDKVVVSQVLLSLGECGFKAGISQITRIKYAIEADIADIRWNLSAIYEIGDHGFAEQIRDSLRWEIQNDIEHIYMLLAMLYDTRSIQLVKENIDSNTVESITYAIELLDVFLSEQLKQRVIPVLDDLTDAERISKLDDFYPRVRLDAKLVLKFIINRDFTQSNRWTKACVLQQIGLQKIVDFRLDLIAQLFNPDDLIREVSAWALYQISPDAYHDNTKRLGDNFKHHLDDLIIRDRKMTVFEKVLFFQRINIFEDVPGITLSYIADISIELQLHRGDNMVLDEKTNNDFFVLASGSADLYQQGALVSRFESGQFIGEMLALPDFVNTNILLARTDLVMLRINKDQFYELLAGNVTLTDKVLAYI